MKTKYVVSHLNPICVCDSSSDAEEIMLSIAEESAYESFCEVMYRPWSNPHKLTPSVFDLVSYFVSAEYWNQKRHSRFSVNGNLLINSSAGWRITEVIDYSEGDN